MKEENKMFNKILIALSGIIILLSLIASVFSLIIHYKEIKDEDKGK